ncbi:MAG: GAF domain-containing protein [Candidatus Rokubacteria bacterium]|nr:GAF domain-containing protein [Candidatus Rokubacteria bacterium]
MRRLVLYPAWARAAAAAAAMLADEFDVRKWAPDEGLPDVPLVLLVDEDGPQPPPAADVRVIGLVDSGAERAWPDTWYSLLPADPGRAALACAVRNAFADLDRAAEIRRLGRELSELNTIGARLGAERDPQALLELILTAARQITASDAGSLYLVAERSDGTSELVFALAQNDTVALPFRAARLPLDGRSIAGYVALTGQAVNLADAYAPPPDSPFTINRSFDEQTGYRTRSMLVVPMRTPPGHTLGVLQLINCRAGLFSAHHEQLAWSLASQAAVALANSRLYESIRTLFEGFVGAAVAAIESRDPTTSGHSFRVAELTVGLAEVVDRTTEGPYAGRRFSADEMRELRYAALLHDFGKVGVREHVLLKAKKLYPAELERIRHRVALIRLGVELRAAHRKLADVLARGRRGFARRAAAVDAETAARRAELDQALDRIVAANEPNVLPREVLDEIRDLAGRWFEDHEGRRQAVLTPDEAATLAIPRGSLTAEEMEAMRSHVVHTREFLSRIPWTRELRRVPEIAGAHHERLDGSGYPRGLRGDAIPVQARMMTIADIYDALTASDRPYKKAVPVERALDILQAERRAGAVDGDLLDLFIAARVFERTRR